MFTYYKTCDFRKTGLHHTLQHRPCEDHTAMRIGPGGLHCHHPCRRSRLLFQG